MDIETKCAVMGHEEETIIWKRDGWTFKHLRQWQETVLKDNLSMSELAEMIAERIESWTIKSNGEDVPFKPVIEAKGEDGKLTSTPNPAVLDGLPSQVSAWLIGSGFRTAYALSTLPAKN